MVYGRDTDATDAGQLTGRHSLRSGSSSNLDDAFDDPEHGDVGRDRLGVHFAWEAVLLVGVAVLGYLMYASHREALSGGGLREILVYASALGFLAFGAAMSLRIAAPNLALGSVAAASALYYAQNSQDGLINTAVVPIGAAMVIGLGIGILVVGFHVPGWAGSLVGTLVVIAWIQFMFPGPVDVAGEFNPASEAFYLFGGFVVVSLVAGLLGVIKPVRRGVGRFRSVGDPATRRGGMAAAVTMLGLILSTGLAAVAGIILSAAAGAANEQVIPSLGLEWTALALGAAMVGGASAFGRRGGVFGTILGTLLLALLITYGDLAGWNISIWLLGAGAVGVGLIVTRLVETFGRPLSQDEEPDDWGDVGVGTGSGWSTGSSGWSTVPASGDPWAGLPPAPASPPPTTTAAQWGETDRWR